MQANTKDWIQYSTAIAMIASAIILTFISFFVTSTVVGGVLWYVSEALVYAGSVFGISIYFKTKFGDFESRTKAVLKDQIEKMGDKIEHDIKHRMNVNED